MTAITDFKTLLTVARQQPEPQRLLFVFLRTILPDNSGNGGGPVQGGQLQPVMCVDKGLDELTTFVDLLDESKRMGADWQIVLIGGLAGKNGAVPTTEDAQEPLDMMLKVVQGGGDLSQFLALDRNDEPILFRAQENRAEHLPSLP